MIELIIAIFIQSLDYMVIFSITGTITREVNTYSVYNVLSGVVFSIVGGVASIFLSHQEYKILITIMVFIVMYVFTKRKVHDLLIMYVIILLLSICTQTIALLLLDTIVIDDPYRMLLAQMLSVSLLMLINWKCQLHQIYEFVQREILLKLFVYIIAIVFFFPIIAYFDLEYSNPEMYITYIFLLVLVAIVGLYQTIKYILYYTNRMPVQLHDVKNILMALEIAAQNSSIEDIQKDIEEAISIIGIEMDNENVEVDNLEDKIHLFIDRKGREKSFSNFNISIHCSESNLSLATILYCLGTLLDNAIESGTKKEIIINVSSDGNSTYISVSNEYERKKNSDFEDMFQKGYSTKKVQTSGYGLYHLSLEVKKHKGEILLDYKYNTEQECHYLTLMIVIKKETTFHS